ncbi:DUF3300 domain-containing protein [Rhodoplanes azumiensis]|uniref:DUF3300 domain-containing protein n=1 Tax=Rhodoplanes azumiensis TaxID=1897628 RepID=A0ABW5AM92_9BRAD
MHLTDALPIVRPRRRRPALLAGAAGLAFLLGLVPMLPGDRAIAQTPAAAGASAGTPAATTPQQQTLSREQLEALVAPIALYSDDLLSQVLMASTYPLEIVQAARWQKANANLSGAALQDALQKQPWDASVKALVAVPQTLTMLNDQLDWTQKLGDAFLAQQGDVLDAVQRLRARADAAGTLKTTKQQKVSTRTAEGRTVFVIEQADPQVVFVPAYDPNVVFGAWPYPAYPPVAWYPPGYVASGALWFGAGVAAGAALWGGLNWWNRQVNIDVNRFNNFNRTNIVDGTWRHNVDHRRGVAYGNADVARQFGRGAADTASREAFRGRLEAGQDPIRDRAGLGDRGGPGDRRPADRAGGADRGDRGGRAATADRPRPAARDAARTREASRGGGAFDGVGRGGDVRRESARGAASRAASRGAAPARDGGGEFRGGGVRGGGAEFRGGGGGPRGGGGGLRGGGGGRGGRR